MAKREGESGVFQIGTYSVSELRQWSFRYTVPSKSARAMGDTNATIAYGIPEITGQLNVYYDNTDTNGQQAIDANGTAAACTLYPNGKVEGEESVAFGNVHWGDIEATSEVDGWIEKTISFSAESITEGTYTTS